MTVPHFSTKGRLCPPGYASPHGAFSWQVPAKVETKRASNQHGRHVVLSDR